MSYPTSRPSPNTAPGDNGNGRPSSQQSQSQSGGQGQSPFDWANYMSFPTPPVHTPSQSNQNHGGNGVPTYNAPGQSGQVDQRAGGMSQLHAQPSGSADSYQSFAQGIALSQRSPSNISFQHPYPAASRPPQQQQQQQQHNNQQSHNQQSQYQQNSQSQTGLLRSPNPPINKGKSPANRNVNNDSGIESNSNVDNGLSLDPDAFSRDIRFQVPQFLSNQMGGAPTFPPGGEAWSGFGANMFSNDNSGVNQLTPGSLFANAFNPVGQNEQAYGTSGNDQGAGRNVLDGLSGFMNQNTWDQWSDPKDKDSNQGGMNNIGTTFYVNPNPSSNVLAQQVSQAQQQNMNQQSSVDQSGSNPRSRELSVSTNNVRPNKQVSQSPRTSQLNSATMPSPRPNTGKASTSFGPPSNLNPGNQFSYVPSFSTSGSSRNSASTANIASSSSQPYAPPSNTSALLQEPTMPPNLMGPSLTDGPGLYSTTGFDMVGVLSRVANRKDPKTVLGPVDLSCSFVVVDVRRYDSPIVYASPTFMALTGYDLPQLLGRNCRYLQSPDGDVVKGSKRKYTDNVAVAHLKRMLNAGKECQASLINYRRGGIPFINLVTVVPIPWDGTDIVYHVGFQVDLVEQPNAILRNMRDGSYQVNYTVANPPQMPLKVPGRETNLGLSQEILEILGPRVNMPGFGLGEEGGKMEWLRMALEQSDDFVHVLSLKGLFQYVSPSVRRVLEYEPEDLVNKNISDICHPSDIVPLMRELKDSTHAQNDNNSSRRVNLVFRIRRKLSGYVWIECSGRLHVEAGKGRKAVILTGRARGVPTVPWDQIARFGGLADTEAWLRISFEGIILHSTSMISELTGLSANRVVGRSIYSLLPGGDSGQPSSALFASDAKSPISEFASAIRRAATANSRHGAVQHRHQLLRRNGYPTEVVTVFYPPKTAYSNPNRPSDADRSSPSSDNSSPSSSQGGQSSETRPVALVLQIKAVTSMRNPPRPIVHPLSSNLFEELETTRGTSWQYELHQLRLLNRRLKEDINAAKARSAAGGGGHANKMKKRKAGHAAPGGQMGGGNGGMGYNASGAYNSNGKMGPPSIQQQQQQQPVPEQFQAAPRHQLAPGFGLVAPGMPSPYYQ